jgi:anti-sigma factor RsiW
MLALSAAGLLEPSEERLVREHVHECAACAAELESLIRLAAGLGTLPAPQPPSDLMARTRARVAAERDRREAYLLSAAAGACACTLSAALCVQLESYVGPWVWVAGVVIPSLLGAGAALMLASHRRLERSAL